MVAIKHSELALNQMATQAHCCRLFVQKYLLLRLFGLQCRQLFIISSSVIIVFWFFLSVSAVSVSTSSSSASSFVRVIVELMCHATEQFNVDKGVVIRACLASSDDATSGPTRHVLVIVVHHIAFDGWSMSILWQELLQLYAGADLSPLPLQVCLCT